MAAPALRVSCGSDSISEVTTGTPQNIAYPAPGSRPFRRDEAPLEPFVIVLFGATGDLAKRKLIPGMAYLDQSDLAPHIQVIGTSLEDLTDDEFRVVAKEAVDKFGTHELTEEQWDNFSKILTYVPQGAGPEALAAAVAEAEARLGAEPMSPPGRFGKCSGCTTFRCRRRQRGP